MNAGKRRQVVYLAYTTSEQFKEPQLLKIYRRSSYRECYDWIADIAKRYGHSMYDRCKPIPGSGRTVLQTTNPANRQRWWVEQWDVS